MHVVLSGYYGFDNVGDEAILFSIIQALRELQPEIEITVLSNNPESTRTTYGVQSVNRWKLKDVAASIKSADGLISGGGSLLQDETGMKSIPYYTGIMKIAKWNKKPVFIYAQGMGPIHKPLSKWIVKTTLNKVEEITVRDERSLSLLKEIGVKKQIPIVPDPVMGLNASHFTNEWIKKQEIVKSFITVSVRDWSSEVPYLQKIADALDDLVKSGYSVVLLPMHGEHDDKTSKELAKLMRQNCYIAPYNASIEEKIAIIGQSNLLIGMRLHSLIFSAINHVPFVAISYDPKIDAFATICDQPVAGHVTKDDWDSKKLFDEAFYILQNEKEAQEKLDHKVNKQQQDALTTAKMALKLFSK
jgi:polysaccharide pyruvyl transferase CsaB